MRSGVGIWLLGLSLSAVLHLGAGAALMAALQPEPIETQPTPESRLNVEAQEVTRSKAVEQNAATETAQSEDPRGDTVGLGAIAQSAVAAVTPPQAAAEEQQPQQLAAVVMPAEVPGLQMSNTLPEVGRTAPADIPTDRLAGMAPTVAAVSPAAPILTAAAVADPAPLSAVAAALPDSEPIALSAPRSDAMRPATLPVAPPVGSSEPSVVGVVAALPDGTAVTSETPDSIRAPSARPPSETAMPQQAASVPAPLREPEVTTSKATLAFPSGGTVDPVSLAAFQSFTQPDSTSGTDLRDSVAEALSVPCARMQVIFDPETTTLQLTGHVPEASQRAPVLAALQTQMGTDIKVADNLLVLPAPQCAALSGIAAVGLPQSTDQITNPLIVGADTHARAFTFSEGQPLVLEMTGADYPAYVYVDYFDADGNVIHLMPNDAAPTQRLEAKQPIQIGARQSGDAGLHVIIGPPYGQEIAAAFASSVPLYEGVRPLVEPAGPYLDWMQQRVAEARADHADFKGEWVYFFVTTRAE